LGDFGFARAAFAGFDLLRRRPVATLGLALVGALISFGGRIMTIMNVHLSRQSSNFAGMASTVILMLAVVGATIAIIGAAVARLDAKPDARGSGLRLGGDEARLFILSLLLVPGLLVVLLTMAIGMTISVAAGVSEGATQDAIMLSAGSVGVILMFGLASRLWPAGAMTVRAGEMRLRAAWRLTRKRRWKIFALFCLVTAVALLIGVGGNIAVNDVVKQLPAMRWSAYRPTTAMLKSAFHPLQLGQLLLQGLIFGLGVVLQAAPATVIARALAEDRASDQAAVFD
jgi:hypothetical protein